MVKSEADLKNVKRQFTLWRQKKSRLKTKGIPEELWQAAVALCGRYTVGRVRNELALDYRQLKARSKSVAESAISESFVTIEMPATPVEERTSFEFVRADGARLRIRMTASSVNQVVADFLGGQR